MVKAHSLNEALASMNVEEDDGSMEDGREAYMAECKRLNQIHALAVIERLPNESFDLSHYKIGSFGGLALAAPFRINRVTKTINLTDVALGDKGLAALCLALKENRQVKSLNLAKNGLTAQVARDIAGLLSNNKTLTSLNLSGNLLKDYGARRILDEIQEGTCVLEELDMSCTGISDGGAVAVAGVISNTPIKSLSIAWNPIQGARWPAIIASLENSEYLRVLDISDSNSLTPELMRTLGEALAVNATLQTLDVTNCSFDSAAAASFAAALDANKGLETLMMDSRQGKLLVETLEDTFSSSCCIGVKSDYSTPKCQEFSVTFPGPWERAEAAAREVEESAGLTKRGRKAKGAAPEADVAKEEEEMRTRLAAKVVGWNKESEQELLELLKDVTNGDRMGGGGRKNGGEGNQTSGSHPVPTLQKLEAALQAAEAEVARNPKNLGALEARSAALYAMSKYSEAAESYLKMMKEGVHGHSVARGFQEALTQMNVARKRCRPTHRAVTLKLVSLEGENVELRNAVVKVELLNAEYEEMLRRLEDILEKHPDVERERNSMRNLLRTKDTPLRQVFRHYVSLKGPVDENLHDTVCLWQMWHMLHNTKMVGHSLQTADMDLIAATCCLYDSHLMAADPHNGLSTLGFYEFVETTIRCSWQLHASLKSLTDRFSHCMEVNIEPNYESDLRDGLQKQVLAVAHNSIFRDQLRARLLRMFKFFAGEAEAPAAVTQVVIAGGGAMGPSPRNSRRTTMMEGEVTPPPGVPTTVRTTRKSVETGKKTENVTATASIPAALAAKTAAVVKPPTKMEGSQGVLPFSPGPVKKPLPGKLRAEAEAAEAAAEAEIPEDDFKDLNLAQRAIGGVVAAAVRADRDAAYELRNDPKLSHKENLAKQVVLKEKAGIKKNKILKAMDALGPMDGGAGGAGGGNGAAVTGGGKGSPTAAGSGRSSPTPKAASVAKDGKGPKSPTAVMEATKSPKSLLVAKKKPAGALEGGSPKESKEARRRTTDGNERPSGGLRTPPPEPDGGDSPSGGSKGGKERPSGGLRTPPPEPDGGDSPSGGSKGGKERPSGGLRTPPPEPDGGDSPSGGSKDHRALCGRGEPDGGRRAPRQDARRVLDGRRRVLGAGPVPEGDAAALEAVLSFALPDAMHVGFRGRSGTTTVRLY
eukprot:jgi/Mesvir1/1029/Mv17556-RA.1